MVQIDEYRAVASQMEKLLSELDRLQLSTVAVHVDFGLRTLEDIITYGTWDADNSKK